MMIGLGLAGVLVLCTALAMPWLKTLYDPAMRQRFT